MEKYVKGSMIGEGAFGKAFLARVKEAKPVGGGRGGGGGAIALGKQVVLKEINMNRVSGVQMSFLNRSFCF